MKKKDQMLQEMPEKEIQELLDIEREKLLKMRMSHAVSPLENPMQIKYVRKKIARLLTEISHRKLKK
tara:strand:+ start:1806 stop:2006 length:201 start_codon:yes stop_codon:yes gene_type:complete